LLFFSVKTVGMQGCVLHDIQLTCKPGWKQNYNFTCIDWRFAD